MQMFTGVPVGNSGYIREMNASSIFRLIDQHGPIARKELAANTRYSAATITNHVKSLLDAGFVLETSKGDSTGGRRPVHVAVNSRKAYILAVELEVAQVRLLLFNLCRTVVGSRSLPIQPGQGPAQVLPRAVAAAKDVLEGARVSKDKLLGIGIGAPGQISNDGVLTFAPNLGWKRTVLTEPFAAAFDCPVLVENEARAGAIGEREGQYPHVNNLAYVSVKEGIGCGIILEGSLYRGTSGSAGEFGHVPLKPDGRSCHCGGRGCWETLASELALLRKTRRVLPAIRTIDELLEIAPRESAQLQSSFDEVGHWLGIGAAAIVNAIGPDLLVIGGSMARFAPWIFPTLTEAFAAQTLPVGRESVQLEFSQMGDQATLHGLGALVFTEHIPVRLAKELGEDTLRAQ